MISKLFAGLPAGLKTVGLPPVRNATRSPTFSRRQVVARGLKLPNIIGSTTMTPSERKFRQFPSMIPLPLYT